MASQFQPFLNSIRAAVDHENWLAALAVTLMLPDICGNTQWPNQFTHQRYTKWLAENFETIYQYGNGPHDYVTDDEMYMLRCAYLHEGSDLFDPSTRKKYNSTVEKFKFVSSKRQHLTKEGTIVCLDVQTFCENMCFHVGDWEKNILSKDALMQTRADELLKIYIFIYPSGIASTAVVGTPTVAHSPPPSEQP